MELLAPIKDKDSAILAVNLGVEALYCSGPFYSARINAGISFEDLTFIIEYAHTYNVKVYITLNTLIFNNNIKAVIDYIDNLVKLSIDALIIQDLGLLSLVSKMYPSLEIHASTQMHVHNIAGVRMIQLYNAKRVVLPRETDIASIKHIKDETNIDIETFIHGALCTSYSGQCYYSAFYKNGSGNLGSCQQNCRKKHSLNKNNNKTMLSLKDLAIQEDLNKLVGISDSFKIEGRLKSLEYLYSTIKYYQDVLKGKHNSQMYDLMQIAFNRKYTKGYLVKESTKQLQNHDRINNHGLEIGEVVYSDNKYIEVTLTKPLARLDNIRIINNNEEVGMVVDKLYKNNSEVEYVEDGTIKIINKHRKKIAGTVFIVKTRRYEKEIRDSQQLYLNKNKLNATIIAKIGNPLTIKTDNHAYHSDFVIEKANKQGFDEQLLIMQLSKTNDTPFAFEFSNNNVDNDLFVVKSKLNDFKRNIIDNEYRSLLNRNKYKSNGVDLIISDSIVKTTDYLYMIRTLEQARILSDIGIKEVYLDNLNILDKVSNLFTKVIPVLPRVIKEHHFKYYMDMINNYSQIMVSELGMLYELKDMKIIDVNYSLNITNNYSLDFLRTNKVNNAFLSVELEPEDIFSIESINTISLGYGYLPLLIMDYCPLNSSKQFECGDCSICQDKQYYLYNDKNEALPLVHYGVDNLELFSPKPINKLNKKINAKYQLISFTIEGKKDVLNIINNLK